MRLPLVSLVLVLAFTIAIPALAAETAPVAVRQAAQNALFEEWYQADLKAHPERATSYGDYRYNDQLDDDSLAGLAYDHATDEAYDPLGGQGPGRIRHRMPGLDHFDKTRRHRMAIAGDDQPTERPGPVILHRPGHRSRGLAGADDDCPAPG